MNIRNQKILGRFVEMIPYAVIGILINYYQVFEKIKKCRKILIPISIIFLLLLFIKEDAFEMPMGYGYQGIYKIFITIFLVTIFYCIEFKIIPDFIKNIINKISKYTMGIYFIHKLVGTIIYISIIYDVLGMQSKSIYNCFIIFIISFIIVWALNNLPIKSLKKSIT